MILSRINIFICTISLIFISCDNFFVSDEKQPDYQCEIEMQYCSDEEFLTQIECIDSGNEWIITYDIDGIQKTLGPTTYSEWEYFSILDDGTFNTLEITEEEANTSTDWDIALLRNHFRTNSGLSGPGDGGAAMIDNIWTCESFNQLTEIPNDIIFEEDAILDNIYQPWDHDDPDEAYIEAPGSVVLENWGEFDLDNDYIMNITNKVLFIKLSNNRYFKIWLYDYYSYNSQSGHVQFYYDFIEESN